MTKVFDISTIEGMKAAERFKAKLNNSCESVQVYTVGWNRVKIVGLQAEEEMERARR